MHFYPGLSVFTVQVVWSSIWIYLNNTPAKKLGASGRERKEGLGASLTFADKGAA